MRRGYQPRPDHDPRGYDPRYAQYGRTPAGGYAPPPPAPKARRWPWVLIVLVGFPVACTAMVGGAVGAAVSAASGPATCGTS